MRRLATAALLAALAPVLGLPAPAHAAWGSVAGGPGLARAADMPTAARPSATSSGRDVSLSWPAAALPDGTAVTGYVVRRYSGAGLPQAVATDCGGIVSGLRCTERDVPAGTWRYTVSTVLGLWSGGESSAATVDVATGTVVASTVAKWQGGTSGYIRKGWPYHVYANVAGDPLSVTADVGSLTPGATAVPLVAGTYTAGGTTYNYRSSALLSSSTLDEGTSAYSVTPVAGVSRTFDVVVDNTPPAGADVDTANGGATPGKPEQDDRVTFSFTEPVDPASVRGGWDGSPTAVVVRIRNRRFADTMTVWSADSSQQLPLGSLALNADVVSGDATFGSSAVPSTMVVTGNAVTVTLGALTTGTASIATSTQPMTWQPSPWLTDRAGNACLTAEVTESGIPDLPF